MGRNRVESPLKFDGKWVKYGLCEALLSIGYLDMNIRQNLTMGFYVAVIQKGGIKMRIKDVKVGKKYRITYKTTRTRQIHWDNGLIPPSGTIVIVTYIRSPVYDYPITIIDTRYCPYGITKHCRASDLIRYEGEDYK